ncbi:hypothetical protein BGX27_008457 [Mortierella sp. AM989]|nr:hypothetical protein BGX27_008457 [Mortierella sp. AM989]
MAMFKENEQYFLERDLVNPPLELRRLVFPWVESTFDEDDPGSRSSWIEDCNQGMLGVDRRSARDSDLHWSPESVSSKVKEACSNTNSSIIADRRSFLKALVRMRRVILQDAVVYSKPNKEGKTLTNNVIESLPHIFKNKIFQDFQTELLAATESHQCRPNLLDTTIAVDKQNVTEAYENISGVLQQLMRA